MTDFIDFINSIIIQIGLSEQDVKKNAKQDIIAFLEDNLWFGSRPSIINGKVMVTNEQITLFREPLLVFLGTNQEDKKKILFSMLSNKFPETEDKLTKFFNIINASEESRYYIADFLLYTLDKDILLMNDKDISELVAKAVNGLIKVHGDMLTFFLSWLKSNYKTLYYSEYIMKNRYSMDYKKEAYDLDDYLQLLYYLFNEDYIIDNEMYSKAAKSKNYADTWLFLSMHFICSLRITDIERISHPILPKEPEVVLNEIAEGTFSETDARQVLFTITWRMCLIPLTPNKTSLHRNISSIKFTVPEDCEVHMGMLLALCEAHRLLAKIPDEEPLIRRIADYDRISKYMGDEIGSLFLESNFRSRSANKSYLQSIYMLTDDILEEANDIPNVKGYILAALARSHKGSYGEFAQTTAVYLKDAKLSRLTPEFVALELFERGVLSFVPSMLLKIITNGEYNRLSVQKQTELIKVLNMSPAEIEKSVAVTDKARRQSAEVVKEILSTNDSKDFILETLHRIGSGSAFSKQPECLCLLTAIKKVCSFDERMQCIGCKYEISTKSTIFLMISEYNRLTSLYERVTKPLEKEKYKNLLKKVVIPAIDEMLVCLKEKYGDDTYRTYEKLIKENII